ncbi:unnamed protein product, partial [marine sediment metagenome]
PNEDGVMVSRKYVAHIGEDEVGSLAKISEEENTTDPQGTTIIVPCKPGDEAEFTNWVRVTTQYWDVRPDIKGVEEFVWPELTVRFESETPKVWQILSRSGNHYGSYNRGTPKPKGIIDGIPYPLNWDNLQIDTLPADQADILTRLAGYNLILFFDTGDLPLTANREEVDYTPDAIELIRSRLSDLALELRKEISECIGNADNLWEASKKWNKVRHDFRDLVPSVEWKGHIVTGSAPDFSQAKASIWQFNRDWKGGSTFRKQKTYYGCRMTISEKTMLLVDEEENARPSRRRLTTLFNTKSDIETVYVVKLPVEDDVKLAESKKELKLLNFDLYDPKKLSDFVKAPIIRKAKVTTQGVVVSSTVPKIWSFRSNMSSRKDSWIAETDNKLIKDGEGLYVLLFRKEGTMVNGRLATNWWLTEAKKALGNSPDIHGIATKSQDKIGDKWT